MSGVVRRPRLVVALALVACAYPAAAVAYRAPTAAEHAAIAGDLGYGSTPPGCLGMSVSTVNERWASLWFKPPLRGESNGHYLDRCHPADGVLVAKRTDGVWREVLAGSDIQACPRSVPVRVGEDLRWASHGVCRAPRTTIWCAPKGGSFGGRVPVVRPRRCATLGPRQYLAEAANLTGLRWKHWGAPVSTGRGIERGYHVPLAHAPVRLRAYRKRRGCHGDFVYMRMRETSRFGSRVIRFPRCE